MKKWTTISKSTIVLVFSLFFCVFGNSQPQIGIPFFQNFTKNDYQAATQNWDFIIDKQEVVCFANNDGLLRYNGKDWRVFSLENHSFLRSIALAKNGIIYAGGQNELGYFEPTEFGDWQFRSLLDRIPESDRGFDDVWDIIDHESGVYFFSPSRVFWYHNDEITVFSSPHKFSSMNILDGEPVVEVGGQGLFFLKDGRMEFVPGSKVVSHSPITNILPVNDTLTLVGTLRQGFFRYKDGQFLPWMKEKLDFLSEKNISALTLLYDGNLAIGTSLDGLIIMTPSGEIRYHLNRTNGLLNNRVRSIGIDIQKNIWLGLDNGIAIVAYNSPFTQFIPEPLNRSMGYAAIQRDNQLFFGTASGLYSIPYQHKGRLGAIPITKVQKSDGQVRSLADIHGLLAMGHHNGGFIIEDNQANRIVSGGGYWLFQPLQGHPEYVLAGTYYGLKLFRYTGSGMQLVRSISGFSESSRFVEQDADGNIWVAHPNKGIFKLRLNEQLDSVAVKMYGTKHGLPDDRLNHVFNINNELIFTGTSGVFSYDKQGDSFVQNVNYAKVFGDDESVIRLYDLTGDKIWYVTDSEIGYIKVAETSLDKELERVRFSSIRKQMVEGFEMIYPFDNQAFIATENGYVYFDENRKWLPKEGGRVHFSEIALTGNGKASLFQGTFWDGQNVVQEQQEGQIPIFKNTENAISFFYSATNYAGDGDLSFQYYLEGLDDDWLPATTKSEKEYTNLRSGSYSFFVRLVDEEGKPSQALSYSFVIKPAWYASNLAFIVYFLILFALLRFVFSLFSKKYDEQKEIVVQSEKIIDRLKNEKWETEIAHKNRELITATLHVLHKNEVFAKVKSSIQKQLKMCTDPEVKINLQSIIKILDVEEDTDSGWEEFVTHFNELHTGFFSRLKKQYTDLSPKDLKMCAYLRMNLSSKEIATLSNISVRGVEGARYRLRKKFNLTKEQNLVEFLMGV